MVCIMVCCFLYYNATTSAFFPEKLGSTRDWQCYSRIPTYECIHFWRCAVDLRWFDYWTTTIFSRIKSLRTILLSGSASTPWLLRLRIYWPSWSGIQQGLPRIVLAQWNLFRIGQGQKECLQGTNTSTHIWNRDPFLSLFHSFFSAISGPKSWVNFFRPLGFFPASPQ